MKTKKILLPVMLLVLTALFTSSAFAISASIGNARMVMNPEITPGKITTIERTIKVNNINDIPVMIELQPNGDFQFRTNLLDNLIVLEPGESKEFRIAVDFYKPGTYEGGVGIKFYEVEGETTKGGGVGLQSKIIATASGPEGATYLEEPADWIVEVIPPTPEQYDTNSTTSTDNENTNLNRDAENLPDNNNATKVTVRDPSKDTSKNSSNKPSPVVGIILMVLIVAAGLIAYSLIAKKKHTSEK